MPVMYTYEFIFHFAKVKIHIFAQSVHIWSHFKYEETEVFSYRPSVTSKRRPDVAHLELRFSEVGFFLLKQPRTPGTPWFMCPTHRP